MPLFDRATSILGEYEEHGIGQRPIVFICHSLGGLVTKKVLEVAESGDLNWQRIPNQTKGIVFLATPHSGSNVANWVKYIQQWLDVDVTTDAVKDLEPHSALLRELNLSYQQMVEKYSIRTQVYYEKRKTRVLETVSVLVVDESSANPNVNDPVSGRVIPVAVDKDHYGICQPTSDRDPPFGRISRFVEECLPRGSYDTKVWTSINVGLGTVPARLKVIELPLTRKDELLPPALRREIELARDENAYNPPDVDRFAYESLALSSDVNPPRLKIPASINARIYVCLLDELSETSKLIAKPSRFHEEGPVAIESSKFDGNIRIVAFVFPLDEAAYRYFEQNGFDSTVTN